MIDDLSGQIAALDYYRAAHRNPLIDALPDLDFGPRILERISFLPPVPDAAVRAEPAKARLRFVGELVRIHVALNRDRELAQSIDSMIREGLLARGSVAQQRAAAHNQTELLVRATEQTTTQKSALEALLARASRVHTPAETRSLMGFSGAGKTRTLHQASNLWPKAIAFPAARDPRLPALQVPFLWVEAPADRTIPSFQTATVRAMEETTEEEIRKQLKGGNRSERIGSLAELLQHFHTGILVIDEIQKLIRANGTPDYILLNFILEIANTLRVPVLFVGTPAAQKLLAGEMRNARRLLGRPWLNFSENSKEWDRLITTLWPYQFTSEFVPLDPELRKTIYHETVGLPGLTVKLFRETQRVLVLANLGLAEEKGKVSERITTDLITAVAKAIFGPVRPMLAALRGGRLEDIACFEDLTLDDKVVDARIAELAEFRRREFQRTLRAIRSEGTRQRRRAKISLRQDVDELLGGVKPVEGLAVTTTASSGDAKSPAQDATADTESAPESAPPPTEPKDETPAQPTE